MKIPAAISRRRLIAGAAAILAAPAGAASPAKSPRTWSMLQAALDEFVHERSAPGVAVAICHADEKPAYPSAGAVAFDSSRAFDADSICRMYSMTKNVTRVATLLLVEDGKLALDQPVTD